MSKWLHDGGWIIDEAYWDWANSPVTSISTGENVRTNTGLLDVNGKAIYKEPNEIGFGRKHNVYSVER